MKAKQLILDLGSSHIVAFENSLLFYEPNVALVKKGYNLELISYGLDVSRLLGKVPESAYFVAPVEGGTIVHPEIMVLILKKVFQKILTKSIFDRYKIYCTIPCGLSIAERETFEDVVEKTGHRDIALVESLLTFFPYTKGKASAIAIMGSDCADIGIVNNSGIITGLTVNLGGNAINKQIQELILNEYGLKINNASAEKMKKEVGTLFPKDKSIVEVFGKTLIDNQYKKIEVSGNQIRPTLVYVYKRYCEIIESSLTTLPSKELAEVIENGLIIAGEGAEMSGLEDYFIKKLRLPVTVVKRPTIAHVLSLNEMLKEPLGNYPKFLGKQVTF